jgi:hypothetical protein
MAVDERGRALRVVCDFCGSQHNYRGGGKPDEHREPSRAFAHDAVSSVASAPRLHSADRASPAAQPSTDRPPQAPRPYAAAADHERSATVDSADQDLESLLRRVIREELGLTPGLPAPRWRGGELVLRPGRPGLQEKSWPIDALFHKIVMIRNRLRTLEQQLNAAEIPEDLKLRLQSYVSGCYGSLTSFNVLFADEADQFKGSGGE